MSTEEERFRQARILVVDDQEGIVTLMERVIREAFGCSVQSVMSGDGALALLSRETFDILVTDMKMPGTHGLDLIEKATQAGPDTHIVVMTGYPGDFPYVEVIQKGAKDFLNKPFLPAELAAKLMRVLRERHLRYDLEVAHKKYRSLFDLSMDGMLLLRMGGLAVEDANDTFCALLGLNRDELFGSPFPSLVDAADRDRFEQWMLLCARSGKGTIGDLQVKHPNGGTLHFDVTITMVTAGNDSYAFLAFRDVTEKREVDRRLAEAAEKDALSGLFNKRSFTNRIEWAVATAAEKGSPLALLMIDLDNFKQCNDTHGHPIGDMLLKNVGQVIKHSIRVTAYDEGFRCGGDEFAVLLHNFTPGGMAVVAERMQTQFQTIERYGTTMSIGVAEFVPGMSSSELVGAADKALYDAKNHGKNTIRYAP